MLVVIHRRILFVFPSPIHKYEDSNTLNSSFTRLAASVPKRTSHCKETDRSGCFDGTILKRMFGRQQISNMRRYKHKKSNVNKYYLLGLQNK